VLSNAKRTWRAGLPAESNTSEDHFGSGPRRRSRSRYAESGSSAPSAGAPGVFRLKRSRRRHPRRFAEVVEGVPINFINLENLKTNKLAAGRHDDLDDLENLP
jgi:hypothetical protein